MIISTKGVASWLRCIVYAMLEGREQLISFYRQFSLEILKEIIGRVGIITLPKLPEDFIRMAMLGWRPMLKDTIITAPIHIVNQIWLTINDRRLNEFK